ncbi:MAG: hypothetical protein B6U69_00180 [Thermofilum sp. ex4484_15]|nr:MAG: hypothetical protein B6U69_00180 [Thermofilum sp. ex4484_15]
MKRIAKAVLVISCLMLFYWSLLILVLIIVERWVLSLPSSIIRSLVGLSLYGAWLYFVYVFNRYIFNKYS